MFKRHAKQTILGLIKIQRSAGKQRDEIVTKGNL